MDKREQRSRSSSCKEALLLLQHTLEVQSRLLGQGITQYEITCRVGLNDLMLLFQRTLEDPVQAFTSAIAANLLHMAIS